HLLDAQKVGRAAQVEALGALAEAAEAAAEVAEVGVVDVAVDDVGDDVPAGALPEGVGHRGHDLALAAAGAKEALDLVPVRRPALERPVQDAGEIARDAAEPV